MGLPSSPTRTPPTCGGLDLASDIDDINRATGDDMPVPATVSTLDRIWLRCIRLMLEGHTVILPDVRQAQPDLRTGP